MHTLFMHSLFKSGMLNFPKSSLTRFYSKKQDVKSSQNHYDTLKITPYATHSEVKSAYYKLTLQYHPDKNKSEYAKQKFQDVSEAYEILGNHELRKNYDRRMKIHWPPISATAKSQYKNIEYNMDSFRTTKMYNFEAWVQAHYGRQMDLTRILREDRERIRNNINENKPSKSVTFLNISLIIITLIVLTFVTRQNNDIPRPRKIEENDKNNS